MPMKNILLVDDHELIRQAIPQYLAGHPTYHIKSSARNGEEAFELIQQGGIDLVITDLNMPVMNGFELIESLNLNCPEVKVMALTMNSDRKTIETLLKLNVKGYLYKNVSRDEFLMGLDDVFAGKLHFAPEILAELRRRKKSKENNGFFTTVEQKILRMIMADLDADQIATKLNTPAKNVHTIIEKMKSKSQSESVPGLIVYAIENGLV